MVGFSILLPWCYGSGGVVHRSGSGADPGGGKAGHLRRGTGGTAQGPGPGMVPQNSRGGSFGVCHPYGKGSEDRDPTHPGGAGSLGLGSLGMDPLGPRANLAPCGAPEGQEEVRGFSGYNYPDEKIRKESGGKEADRSPSPQGACGEDRYACGGEGKDPVH